MTWRVVWIPKAEEDLAAIWLASRFRSRINDATKEIDRQLEDSPLDAGESRIGIVRILFCPPLACHFVVDESSRTAFVTSLWKFNR